MVIAFILATLAIYTSILFKILYALHDPFTRRLFRRWSHDKQEHIA